MGLDFQKINNIKIGYQLHAKQIGCPHTLEDLYFKEFIPPYSYQADSYQGVCQNLEQALSSALEQQDSVTEGKRSVMLDVLATAALQREAIRNSIVLIRIHYCPKLKIS